MPRKRRVARAYRRTPEAATHERLVQWCKSHPFTCICTTHALAEMERAFPDSTAHGRERALAEVRADRCRGEMA